MSVASKLTPALAAAASVTPVEGVDGLAFAVPNTECISAGLPPVAPGVVLEADAGFAVRTARAACGSIVTAPKATTGRVSMTLKWGRLNAAQAAALTAFFVSIGAGQQGSLLAMDVDIDGSGSVVPVRLTGAWECRLVANTASGKVYEVAGVPAEEVL